MRLAQHLQLPHFLQIVCNFGIAGSSPRTPIQSVASLQITPLYCNNREINLTAIVLPKFTCDLPVSPVPFDSSWSHVSDLLLADPAFGLPGLIDLLLGVDIFVSVLFQGQQTGPPEHLLVWKQSLAGFLVATLNHSLRQNRLICV